MGKPGVPVSEKRAQEKRDGFAVEIRCNPLNKKKGSVTPWRRGEGAANTVRNVTGGERADHSKKLSQPSKHGKGATRANASQGASSQDRC